MMYVYKTPAQFTWAGRDGGAEGGERMPYRSLLEELRVITGMQ